MPSLSVANAWISHRHTKLQVAYRVLTYQILVCICNPHVNVKSCPPTQRYLSTFVNIHPFHVLYVHWHTYIHMFQIFICTYMILYVCMNIYIYSHIHIYQKETQCSASSKELHHTPTAPLIQIHPATAGYWNHKRPKHRWTDKGMHQHVGTYTCIWET